MDHRYRAIGQGRRSRQDSTYLQPVRFQAPTDNCDGTPSDGSNPYGALVQATHGAFYGTTYDGGATVDYGTIFRITPGGQLTTLHTFSASTGYGPQAGLLQGTDGTLYGTTAFGGTSTSGLGTIYSLPVGLGPFIWIRPIHKDASHLWEGGI